MSAFFDNVVTFSFVGALLGGVGSIGYSMMTRTRDTNATLDNIGHMKEYPDIRDMVLRLTHFKSADPQLFDTLVTMLDGFCALDAAVYTHPHITYISKARKYKENVRALLMHLKKKVPRRLVPELQEQAKALLQHCDDMIYNLTMHIQSHMEQIVK